MAAPTSVEIRAYQVGFGDCFLVSFVYSKTKKRHVLIDFGTTRLPTFLDKSAPAYMKRVAEHIKATCDGKLTAVVATHRHADHISGFSTTGKGGGSGRLIAECEPDVVLQPWTEDPKAAKNAKAATRDSARSSRSFVSGLNAMHRIAEYAFRVGSRPPSSMSVALARQLQFLGQDNIKNRSAVENLIAMGKRRGATAVWAHHGSDSGLAGKGLLEGVKVRVLGPPTLEQTESIRKMRSSDPDQFWQLLGGTSLLRSRVAPAEKRTSPNGAAIPPEARWFRDRIARLSADQLLEIVRVLDDQMNNTSLILLFEVGNRKLLFPGDAQIENWSWALDDAPDAAKTRELLSGVDFYKVGHHGSRNATPRQLLWENFAKRHDGTLTTAMSTLKGKHGDARKRTEVPRTTLVDALSSESDLYTTQDYKFGVHDDPCQLITITIGRK